MDTVVAFDKEDITIEDMISDDMIIDADSDHTIMDSTGSDDLTIDSDSESDGVIVDSESDSVIIDSEERESDHVIVDSEDDGDDAIVDEATVMCREMLYLDKLNGNQSDVINQMMSLASNISFRGRLLKLPMGSGKTRVCLISGLNMYKQFLIVASKTLIGNWIDELKLVLGEDIKYEILHRDYLGKSIDYWRPSPNTRIIITTPEVIVKSYKMNKIENHFVTTEMTPYKLHKYHLPQGRPFISSVDNVYGVSLLHRMAWSAIYIDECQNHTNIHTQTSRSIASLYCRHRWLLSGTPITEPTPDRLLGLYLLLNESRPNCLPEIRMMLKSGGFRGVKELAISCSPPVINAKLHVNEIVHQLSHSETVIFECFREIILEWFEYYNRMREALPQSPVLSKIRGHLLSLLTYTRISLVSPKLALTQLLSKIEGEPFLYGLNTKINKIRELVLGSETVPGVSNHSTRLEMLYDILTKNDSEQFIVFSNFLMTLETAREYVTSRPHLKDRTYYIMNSRLNLIERADLLDQFKNDKTGVLFMTYGMGSEGLNLQSAHHVVMLDLYWNVERERQSIARTYRMRQTRDVYQYYLISNLQFEHAILTRQIAKTRLISQFIEGGTEMIDTDLKAASIGYKDMVNLIKKEDIQGLLASNGRFTYKGDKRGTSCDPKPPRQ